ncbi:MAG: thioredoxin [Rubrobacteridae bacterium]|nr:thioredoxin [Rubrobacteridae bacterium]
MGSEFVKDINDAEFEAQVIKSDQPVIVDFWAPWCGPCRMVGPKLEELAQEKGDAIKVVKVNVDDNQQWAGKYGVMSIPTIMLFKNGEAAETIVGAVPKEEIVKKFGL